MCDIISTIQIPIFSYIYCVGLGETYVGQKRKDALILGRHLN
jgi:hypothetical protein